jgi:hypothetical protein
LVFVRGRRAKIIIKMKLNNCKVTDKECIERRRMRIAEPDMCGLYRRGTDEGRRSTVSGSD